MTYKPVDPPFELNFEEMSQKGLRAYFDWFLGSLSEREKELEAEVRRAPGFETWTADRTPASLDALGEWFAGQVEERPLTDEEMAKGRSSVPEEASFLLDELPTTTPTFRTLSLTFDVGAYLGQVLLKNCEGVSWQQVRSGKSYHDYGQPVLVGLGPVRCSPLLLVMTLAHGIADGKKSGTGLRKLYDIWSSKKVSG
ncbi:MAG TPA: hypothetical protein VFS43_04795 [Polyangiaceae bacterium]|nr:hypothetical protein [Polyangiaceae bacterium]